MDGSEEAKMDTSGGTSSGKESGKEDGEGSEKLKRTVESMLNSMKLSEEEIQYRMKNFSNVDVGKEYYKFLKCTKCEKGFQKVLVKGEKVGVHPLLGVLLCENCCDYYGDGNFSLDSEGEDKYCRWCGEGGTIFACTKCICGFCNKCIKKHFGKEELESVEKDDFWVCYFCNPKPLWYLRSICSLAEQASLNKKEQLKIENSEKKSNTVSNGLEESPSSESDDSSISDPPFGGSKKRLTRTRRASKKEYTYTSSSEDEKNLSVTRNSRKKVSKRLAKNRSSTSGSDSFENPPKKPKKKIKTDETKSDSLAEDKKEIDKELENKRKMVLEKLRGIWKLTEIVSDIGLTSSKKRLKRLSSDEFKSVENLQNEFHKLKSITSAMLSSLNTAKKSIDSVTNDLNFDSVKDESKLFQNEEMKIKEVAKKIDREDSDSESPQQASQGNRTKRSQNSSTSKDSVSSQKNGSRSLFSSDDSDKPLKRCKSSEKKRAKSSDSEGDKSEKKNSPKEVVPSEPVKPVLKVKSFAKMLAENVLKNSEIVIEDSPKKNDEGNSTQVEVYVIDTDSDKKSEKEREEKKKNKKNLSGSEEEESEPIKRKKKSKVKKRNSTSSEGEESDGKNKSSKKKTKNGSSSSEWEESRTVKGKSRRLARGQKQKTANFEKFKEKRDKYLKSKEASTPKKKNKVLESSGSENEKTEVSKKRIKKSVLDSSEEENKSSKENKDKESNSSKSEEEAKAVESDASVQTKGVSSGETSSDEDAKKMKKTKNKNTKSGSSSDEDGDKKKKGRKNIKKILKKDSLHVETKEALKNEEERRKRVEARQKLFEETFPEDSEKTDEPKRLILDFDPETKEPLVTVHKKLVKKLKPHQVKGIKFMWDNCFESVQRLEEDSGSGCILAHCMGLGKTLQVVTFIHTIMTHDVGVNTVLVVCPLNTVKNWIHEFEMWLSNIHTDPITLYDLVKYKKAVERCHNLKEWHRTGGVLVISYDLFRTLTKVLTRNSKKMTKKNKVFESTLLDPGPDLVVCDEGHLLKNQDTALSKCMNLIKTSRRIVLTGTPLQNNLIEYHCMVQFVKPNILGTRKEFMNRFVNPISNGQFEDSTELDVKIMKRRSHVLHSMLSGCVQRFDYSVLTPFLPEKHEYVLSISLTEAQAKAYKYYIENMAARATGSTKTARLFNDYHNLQRIWTHPKAMLMQSEKQAQKELDESESEGSLKDFVVDSDESESSTKSSNSSSVEAVPVSKRRLRSNANEPDVQEDVEEEEKTQHWWNDYFKEEDYENIRASNKLAILFSLLKQCGEVKDKVLVFSQSLYSLDLIEYFLKKVDDTSDKDGTDGFKDCWVLGLDYFRLDGKTSSENRAAWCKSFNKDSNTRARLFLISTRAGGIGINLYGANRVVVFDASWNPSHDLQSIFRVYRFGQKKTCYIYRFLAEATMEEKIYERQVTKLSLAHRVVDEHQIERHYSMMNLQELYKFDPTPVEKRQVPKLPKDTVFADLLTEYKDVIVGYHEHDSLLENQQEEELSEEERKAAWKEYEEEKVQRATNFNQMMMGMNMVQGIPQNLPQFSGNAYMMNPMFLNQMAAMQNQNMPRFVGPSIPLDIIRRGMNVGIAPFYNESPDMFLQRLNHREHWMSVGPRET